MGSLFGTDGVRGVANEYPMTSEMALRIGRATAYLFKRKGHTPRIIIGKDTRVSGYMLENALVAGICSMGVNALLVGPLPTPGIAFATTSMRADAGIVLSASHNPFQDNGIKIFSRNGFKLPDEKERKIEELVLSNNMDGMHPSPNELGKAYRIDDARGRYIVFLKSTFPKDYTLEGTKVVLDCAHGATYRVAPETFFELGAEVTTLFDEPNGENINDNCGSTQPGRLRETVLRERADLGIALDGDGDRVILVDANGDVVDGDKALFILARERHRSGTMKGGVVGTLMTNLGLEHALTELDVDFVRTKVGDRYVMSRMMANGWELGGETSGHIICLDKATTGDGIVAALQILQAMARSSCSLAEMAAGMAVYPQTTMNVPVPGLNGNGGFDAFSNTSIVSAVREAESMLGDKGRVVLRPSGTEPVVRVMVEGMDAILVQKLVTQLADVVRTEAAA